MQNFKKFLYLLSPRERKHAVLLILMILIMAFLEMIGVMSILPFMAVVSNPILTETNPILNYLFNASSIFGVQDNQEFLLFLGSLVFIVLIASLSFRALTAYTQTKFVQMRQYSIGKRLLSGYLHQPYSWFLSRHSADIGKTILSETNQIIGSGINPLLHLIASSTVAVALVSLLILTEPKLALIIGLVIGSFYGLIYMIVRRHLNKIGKETLKSNELRFLVISEAFSAAKEVKLGGLEKVYVNRFSNAAFPFAQNQALASIIRQLPRFILEAIVFGGILLIVLYFVAKKGSFNEAIPVLSLYVFAGYRLMPAMQQIYASFAQITFANASLDKLYNDIRNLKPLNLNHNEDNLLFNKKIELKNVHYNYPNTTRTTLKNINLTINSKTTVGMMGVTGSGKTTAVDIIIGLLEPQKGTLVVDEQVITKKNIKSWQRSIGYVPQDIYLADQSVAANIAFGIDPENINIDAVKKASRIANLHDFVISELPKQYETIIGENGVRLSGGQRQRIGIARALYHTPKLLILDEATSALDNQTEQIVMEAVNNLRKDITIVIIAHRLTTLKNCDNIFKLEKGHIIEQGTFKELIE
jgi:ATP-binding cassette, subfamily B, bacterial PglK